MRAIYYRDSGIIVTLVEGEQLVRHRGPIKMHVPIDEGNKDYLELKRMVDDGALVILTNDVSP